MIFLSIVCVLLYLCGMGNMYILMVSHPSVFNRDTKGFIDREDKIALALWPIMVCIGLWVHFFEDDLFNNN